MLTVPITKQRSELLKVFGHVGRAVGGHPTPVWLDAADISHEGMQTLARESGHESVFVLPPDDSTHQHRFRFFVPNHEMEMCGHATIAALWLMRRKGSWDGQPTTIKATAGLVVGRVNEGKVEISQPKARVLPVAEELVVEIAECLRISRTSIQGEVINAATARMKTFIRLEDTFSLDALQPDFSRVRDLCTKLGSTGLYAYAVVQARDGVLEASARHFQQASGYPECPATGIAATALAWGLRHLQIAGAETNLVRVRQGEAMGSPSLIYVRLPKATDAECVCWLYGEVDPIRS